MNDAITLASRKGVSKRSQAASRETGTHEDKECAGVWMLEKTRQYTGDILCGMMTTDNSVVLIEI